MRQSQQSATQTRNRATGYSDTDWGALEKRLSDTRDLLQDILRHLRQVLDNLKTAGARSSGSGRAWRKSDSFAEGQRGQYGHRQGAAAAGAQKTQGTSAGSRFQAGNGASSANSSANSSRPTSDNQGGADRNFRSGAFSGQAGQSGRSTAGASSGKGDAGKRQASDNSSRTFRQDSAGERFSWSSRGDARSSSSSAGKSSDAGQRTSSRQQQASGEKAGSSRQAGREQAQAGAGFKGREQHRRAAGSGGSSYQDYRQRTHKQPLGPGRMTLIQAYAILCVAYPSTEEAIKAAYRKQARRHHPDLGGDEEMMKSINQAYELALSWCSPVRSKGTTWAA